VLAELKLTLNRREQFALEKVLVDEQLGLGPLEELLATPISPTSWSTARADLCRAQGQAGAGADPVRDEEHLFQIAQRHRQFGRPPRRPDHALADARLKDGSRVNVIVPPLSAPRHGHLDP
jgi:pilus assembly protein CpaF